MDIIKQIEREHMRMDIPSFKPGDAVKVYIRIVEGEKERIQMFAGNVIRMQRGTTGAIYIDGDADEEGGYGFEGLPVTKMEFDYAALAFTAMINGEVDYVIVDDAPAKAIAKAIG